MYPVLFLQILPQGHVVHSSLPGFGTGASRRLIRVAASEAHAFLTKVRAALGDALQKENHEAGQ